MRKIVNIESFKNSLLGIGFFEYAYISFFAWSVVVLEIFTCLMLLYKRRLGMVLLLFSLILFTSYVVIIYNFYVFSPCGCGGVMANSPFHIHVGINVLLIVVTVASLFYDLTNRKTTL